MPTMERLSDGLDIPSKKSGNFLDEPALMAQADDGCTIFNALGNGGRFSQVSL
jgi:hypothetical protein